MFCFFWGGEQWVGDKKVNSVCVCGVGVGVGAVGGWVAEGGSAGPRAFQSRPTRPLPPPRTVPHLPPHHVVPGGAVGVLKVGHVDLRRGASVRACVRVWGALLASVVVERDALYTQTSASPPEENETSCPHVGAAVEGVDHLGVWCGTCVGVGGWVGLPHARRCPALGFVLVVVMCGPQV